MATPQTIELAKTLPPRLLRFFQRYPPPQLFPTITSQIAAATPADSPATISTTPPADPNATITEVSSPDTVALAAPENLEFPNPFQPTKNFTTGRWHGPVYGLRKQADLVKLANAHGVVDLLPWTIKKPGEKEARRIERGLTVKGTGEGQRVKGKLWERTLKGRLEMRRQAMLDMPRLIQEWKQVCFVCAGWVSMGADGGAERSWAWMEEVAEW
jgi:large subunit ribosomal protein L25